jgi:tetratricopeptide (TPR) repeat protein
MIYRLLFIPLIFLVFSCQEQKASKKLAENYFKEQNYEQALAELDKLIKHEPDSINHYSLRVMTYSNLGMFKEEIQDLNKIIELNIGSKSINAHNERAIAYIRIGENSKALEDINYVIENKEDSSDINQAYIQKASILYVLNDLESSKEFYQKALELNNNKDKGITTQALIGLSNISKDVNESLKLLNKAIEIDSENGMAFGARGAIYLEQENIEKAFKDFQKAKKYDSNNPDIHFNIGQLYANYANNLDSATYYFEKAIKLAPQSQKNDMIYTNLGVIKHRSGRLTEALKDFETAEKLNSENDLLLYNYAMLLSEEKEYTKALLKINKAIEINSIDPEYYNLKGTILMDKSNFNESERAFKKAIEINPNYGTPYYNLGYLKSNQNNIKEAISYYDIAIQLDFDLPATLVNRALLLAKLNKNQEACSDLNRALKLGRTDIKTLIERNCR